MSSDPVRLQLDGGVAHLTLARPEAGNAIDLAVARALLDAVVALAGEPAARVVVLRGEGPNFCVGGDLKAFSAFAGDGARLGRHLREVTTPLHAAIAGLARLEAPVVAAVQGSAAGAGMSLAAGADLVVAAESATFVLAYGRVGLSPDGGGSWYLPRRIGVHRALELALTHRPLRAPEALAWGLATSVVPDDELDATVAALAGQLAAGAPGAAAVAKRLLRASLDTSLASQLELEQESLVANAERHGSEGITAFLQKRPPAFGPEGGPSR